MIVFLFITISGAIQLPGIQSYLVRKTTEYIGNFVHYPIQIGAIGISWFNKIELSNVLILDRKNHEMIKVPKIIAKIKLADLLKRDVIVEHAQAIDPIVNLYYDKEINDVNISDFIFSLMDIGVDKSKPKPIHVGKYSEFTIKGIELVNGYCQYDDPSFEKSNDRFDFTHFAIKKINITADDFKIVADTLSMNVSHVSGQDQFSGKRITNGKMFFSVCENYLMLKNLNIRIGNSVIKNYVLMEFDRLRQLSSITDSVQMTIHADNSIIYSSDLSIFFPELKGFDEKWVTTGDLFGKVNDFKIKDIKATFGNGSSIEGDADMKGLPFWSNTFINARVNSSDFYLHDLSKYGLYNKTEHIPKLKFNGQFKGITSDFNLKGFFDSNFGKANVNLEMKIPHDIPEYVASINADNLNLGLLLGWKDCSNLTGNIKIKGKGLDLKSAVLNFNSDVKNVKFHNYNYKNVLLTFKINQQKLQGSFDIKDSNIVIDVTTNSFLNQKNGYVKMQGNLSYANLQKLNFSPKILKISSDFTVNSNFPKDLDHFIGSLVFKNIQANDSVNKINIPYIKIETSNNENQNLIISSDVADISLYGNFGIEKLIYFSKELYSDFEVAWLNNDSISNNYYKQKLLKSNIYLNYNFKMKECRTFMKIFTPSFTVSNNATLSGEISSDSSLKFTMVGQSDTLNAFGMGWVGSKVNIDIVKERKRNSINANWLFSSDYQLINNNTFVSTERLFFKSNWTNKIIDFEIKLKQYNENNEANVNGNFTFLDNQKRLKFLTADFKLLDKKWKLDEGNLIILSDKKWHFKDIILSNESQKVSLLGNLSTNENDVALIRVDNFYLRNFNKLINVNIDGEVNGYVVLKDIFNNPKVYSQIAIKDFKLKKLIVGDAQGNSQWDNINKRLVMNFNVHKNNENVFDLSGSYLSKPNSNNDNLDIVATLNHTNLAVLDQILESVFSDLEGKMSGKIDIKGTLSQPKFSGDLQIDDGALKINYLNTKFTFDDKITLTPNSIVFNNVILNDPRGSMGIISGSVDHSNFKNFKMNIGGIFKNVLLLDIPQTDSSVYFGKAIATGSFSINGSFDHFFIKIDAISNKGTQLFVPFNDESVVQKNEFIIFNKKESGQAALHKIFRKKINQDKFKIEMDFNFEFTPDAYCELILNPQSFDKISGYGNGKINMQINTDGDFSLFGNYIFEKDSYYIFSLLNSINKKFNIHSGSRVIFNGDPYQAQLDVTASYDDRVPLYTLIPDTSLWRASGIRTPYPVSTYMYLKGLMFKPTISYDIKISNYPSVVGGVPLFNYVTAFENRIHNNENEMNNQVMGLLVFRRFLSPNTGLDAAVGGTVSEILTNQLSNIISKVDKNLSVDLNMNGLNRDALNSMQVRVSYTLLDGRVRVTRSTGNVQNQNTSASVIGDWTVEYMLTEDGKFRLKGFNRNNPNPLATGSSNASNMSAGASIMHTSNFSTLNPFKGIRKKKKKEISKPDTLKSPLQLNLKY
ncbi:MAG: translocation/assembly module TamB domain-containing protein [Bacteroidota bacterium]|nr:translocation/assembly module TamB domain-containing protein [Bacteroidota bacterium]